MYCYPQPCKRRARRICEAFAKGAGGSVIEHNRFVLPAAAAMIYGISDHALDIRRKADKAGLVVFCADNAYFRREAYIRITKNQWQHDGQGHGDWQRLKRLDLRLIPGSAAEVMCWFLRQARFMPVLWDLTRKSG